MRSLVQRIVSGNVFFSSLHVTSDAASLVSLVLKQEDSHGA